MSQEEVMKVSSAEGGAGTKVVEFQDTSSAPSGRKRRRSALFTIMGWLHVAQVFEAAR